MPEEETQRDDECSSLWFGCGSCDCYYDWRYYPSEFTSTSVIPEAVPSAHAFAISCLIASHYSTIFMHSRWQKCVSLRHWSWHQPVCAWRWKHTQLICWMKVFLQQNGFIVEDKEEGQVSSLSHSSKFNSSLLAVASRLEEFLFVSWRNQCSGSGCVERGVCYCDIPCCSKDSPPPPQKKADVALHGSCFQCQPWVSLGCRNALHSSSQAAELYSENTPVGCVF